MAHPQQGRAHSKAFPRRSEIWLIALDPTIGHEIKKTRPAVIVQNDITNEYLRTTIVVPLTTTVRVPLSPTHVLIERGTPSGLDITSVALFEQMRVVDRVRLIKHIGRLDERSVGQADEAIAITLGLKRL